MINPSDVIKFDRTDAELEEWWLFSCVVAGKTATTQARLLEGFIKSTTHALPPHLKTETPSPFDGLRHAIECDVLNHHLVNSRLGQYGRLGKCFTQSISLDLRNDPVEAFEAIHGVGPKTARMFIMHSRPNQRLAAIDTHVLKHLKANGYEVPAATPTSGKQYRELELAFLKLADDAKMNPSEYDLMVWKSYARVPAEI